MREFVFFEGKKNFFSNELKPRGKGIFIKKERKTKGNERGERTCKKSEERSTK